MNEWKGKLDLGKAPDSFMKAIRAGAGDIRNYEARRRRTLRCFYAVAAALAIAGVGAYAALNGMRPRNDDIFAAPGQPTPTTTPDPTSTPAPSATDSLLPTATPAPDDAEGMRMDIEMGNIIYGGKGYLIAHDCAENLPETPRLEHALYKPGGELLDPDTVAYWLWQGDCRKETYNGSIVYVHEADKNVPGDYKVKGYVFDGESNIHVAPDDPSRLRSDDFESRDAALAWAEKWFGERLPARYLEHPHHPLEDGFEGERVKSVYGFSWPCEIEGVPVYGSGLSGHMCTYGPDFFLLDLTESYVPVEGIGEMPYYLTAEQAVDALNNAAAQEIVRDQYGDCGFGSLNDVIEEVRPVFLKERFFSDQYYRLSWQISVRSRERKSVRVFFVDATTGRVWDDHDGAIDTVYTQYLG